ncbi:MAG: membrane protein insertion efficiency factor YidD [Actinomycetota bacterium]
MGRSVLWVWDHSIGWLVRGFFLVLIVGYQRLISPLLPASCRYHPSCSAYGFDAIAVHGSAKGLVLTLWRLLRCNPWSKGGVDPVPDKDRWLPNIHPDGSTRTGPDTSTQLTLPERRTT